MSSGAFWGLAVVFGSIWALFFWTGTVISAGFPIYRSEAPKTYWLHMTVIGLMVGFFVWGALHLSSNAQIAN